ncbi:MAG: SCP2 sterol-binding domain-containing protein [Oscillospiraceae bacterium]|nr:SCP2 sterol-binding domain-containing protein [Oscillospiraceae bacterium]
MAKLTYEKVFEDVKKSLMKADTSALDRDFAIQCNIQGDGEGCFYIENKDGQFSVEPYDYKDCDAQLNLSGDNFMKMFAKKVSGTDLHDKGLLTFSGDVGVILLLGGLQPKEADAPKKKAPAKKKS